MQTHKSDAKLARLLDAAAEVGEPLRVVVDGRTFEIVVRAQASSEDPWAEYDPEGALEALEESAGVLGGIDADDLIAEIKQG